MYSQPKPKHIFSQYESIQKWTEVEQNKSKWTQMDQIEQSALNGNKEDQSGLNITKWTNVD